MRYGIRDGLLKAPLEEMCGVASQIGFDGIEYCIGADYRESLLWQDGGADRLRGLAEAAGVEISSLSPGVFAQCHPALPEADKRSEGIEILRHVIACCAPLGTKDILVPMFPKQMDAWSEATWTQLVDGLRDLADTAGKAGVVLDLEATFNADQLLTILGRVDSAHLKVYHDTANTASRGQDPAAELRALGPGRVGMIHAKDTDRQMLGDGTVDFEAVDGAMRAIAYDGWIVLETPVGDDPAASNAANLAFIRRFGA
jgi:sugar phosphate isomerase/epimerase